MINLIFYHLNNLILKTFWCHKEMICLFHNLSHTNFVKCFRNLLGYLFI